MNCKHCNAQLAEDVKICPECGKEQETVEETAVPEEVAAEEVAAEEVAAEEVVAEEVVAEEVAAEEVAAEEVAAEEVAATEETAPAKSSKKITAAIIAIVLVAGILIGLVAGSMGGNGAVETTPTEPVVTEPAAPVVIPSDGNPESPLCKASYTVSDADAAAAADVVVATMGDKKLTNAQLQAFYWQEIYMFLNEYGSYVQYLGLDVYSPFDSQLMAGDGTESGSLSWQQFFLDGAVATWKNYQALALEAEAEGYQMSEEEQAELDAMPEGLETGAQANGFENAEALIKQNVGTICTKDAYLEYMDTYYNGMSYYYDFCNNIDPTDAEVEAYFAENEQYFAESEITRDTHNVNIRHALLVPNDGQYTDVGEDGYPIYPEEAWEACRVEAEELYSKWQEGDVSEDSFAELAMTYSMDGTASIGGLFENVVPGQMVDAFDAWCFDESRQVGDHGLVKTEYGYHLIYFCAHRNWFDYAREGLIDSIAYDKIPQTTEKYPATVDYSLVQLSEISFG